MQTFAFARRYIQKVPAWSKQRPCVRGIVCQERQQAHAMREAHSHAHGTYPLYALASAHHVNAVHSEGNPHARCSSKGTQSAKTMANRLRFHCSGESHQLKHRIEGRAAAGATRSVGIVAACAGRGRWAHLDFRRFVLPQDVAMVLDLFQNHVE